MYVLQLDDDSAPLNPDMLVRAAELLETRPDLGLIAFHVFNGCYLPDDFTSQGEPRYTASFVGCGALLAERQFFKRVDTLRSSGTNGKKKNSHCG